MEAFEDSPRFDRHFGNDESAAALLPHIQSPRDARTGRKITGTYEVVRTPRGGFGLGCRRRYGDAPTSSAIVSPFILQGPTKRSKSGFDLVFSSKRPVVTEAKAGRSLVVDVK